MPLPASSIRASAAPPTCPGWGSHVSRAVDVKAKIRQPEACRTEAPCGPRGRRRETLRVPSLSHAPPPRLISALVPAGASLFPRLLRLGASLFSWSLLVAGCRQLGARC